MNKVLRTALTFCLACVGMVAVAQTDVTNYVLSNAGFDDDASWQAGNVAAGGEANSLAIADWTVAKSAAWSSSAAFGYGTEGQINGVTVPATNPDGEAAGGALGVSAGWGGTVAYAQGVMLPAGTYTISYKAMNLLENVFQMKATITLNGVEKEVATDFGYNSWETYSAEFTLEEDVENVDLKLAFTAVSGGSGNNAKIFVDGVVITTETESAIQILIDKPIYEAVIAAYDGASAEFRSATAYIVNLAKEADEGAVNTSAVQEKMYLANQKLTKAKEDITAAFADGTCVDVKEACETLIADALALIVDAKAMADANLVAFKSLPSGEYYLMTTVEAKNYYLGPANDWGTHASLIGHSVPWTFVRTIVDGVATYTLEGIVSNGGTNYFLNGDWCDGAAKTVYFTENEDGTYLLSTAAEAEYYKANGKLLERGAKADALKWTIVSTAIENIKAGDDISYLIKDANFDRNNRYGGGANNDKGLQWTKTSASRWGGENLQLCGGTDANKCAESYCATFTVSQTFTGLPAGYYLLTAQAFYRPDYQNTATIEGAPFPYIFANGNKQVFPLRTGSENSMNDASNSFAAGNYAFYVPVKVDETGSLTVGAGSDVNHCWAIFDNFGLIYQGTEESLEYVTYMNEAPYAELIAAYGDAVTAFAAAQLVVADFDAFVQAAVAAEETRIEGLLAETDEVEGATTIKEKIEAAYAAKKCGEQKDALLAEIAQVVKDIAAWQATAQGLQTANDDAYAALTEASTDLVATWQDTYDKINSKYKPWVGKDEAAYNGYLTALNDIYVDIDPIAGQIEEWFAAGKCAENKEATLATIADLKEQTEGVLETALAKYYADVDAANEAEFAEVKEKMEAVYDAYKAAILAVDDHYAEFHAADALAAQEQLFTIYNNVQAVEASVVADTTKIAADNRAMIEKLEVPLAQYDNTDHLAQIAAINGVEGILTIMTDLEGKAETTQDEILSGYDTQFKENAGLMTIERALIKQYELDEAQFAELMADANEKFDALAAYIYEPMTMTIARRNNPNNQITKWSVYGSDDAEAADKAWIKLADIETPFGNKDEVLDREFNAASYKYLRFYIEATNTNSFYGHISEFQLSVNGEKLITDAAQFSSPSTDPQEGSLAALIDGDKGTFWHSNWHNKPTAAHSHYLQVALNDGAYTLKQHGYLLEEEEWQCAVPEEEDIKAAVAEVAASIDALGAAIVKAHSADLLSKIEAKEGEALEALEATLPETYEPETLEKYEATATAIATDAAAIVEAATAADAEGKLSEAKFNEFMAQIGTPEDEASADPAGIDVTLVPGDLTAVAEVEFNGTKDGVNIACTKGTVTADQIRVFKSQTITFSAEKKILKVVFTCTANGAAKYGPGCFNEQDGYTFEAEGNTGTWKGAATSVSFTAELNQVRLSQVIITLEDGEAVVADPTIYARINALDAEAEAFDIALKAEKANQAAYDELAADIDQVDGNLAKALEECKAIIEELGQTDIREAECGTILGDIIDLDNELEDSYEAGTCVADKADFKAGIKVIEDEMIALMNKVYRADIESDLAAVKDLWNIAYASGEFDTDIDLDALHEAIIDLENEYKAIDAIFEAPLYNEYIEAIAYLADQFEDYEQWMKDNVELGDVNFDGEVTVTDAVMAASIVLETLEPNHLQTYAADVNQDGEIDIADVVIIINKAVGIEPVKDDAEDEEEEEEAAGVKAQTSSDDYLVLDGKKLNLINETEFTAFQFDVNIEAGAEFTNPVLSDRAANLNLSFNRINDTKVRVIAFSLTNSVISDNEGLLLTLNTNSSKVVISNAKFSTKNAKSYNLEVVDATAIRSISADAVAGEVYTIGGARVAKLQKGVNIVKDAEGNVRKVLVK